MEIKKGIAVSPGVVISTAVVLDAEDLVVPKRQIAAGEAGAEVERLGKAITDSAAELVEQRDVVAAKYGKEIGGRLAARLGSGLLVDVVEVKSGATGVHSIFGGAFTVEAQATGDTPVASRREISLPRLALRRNRSAKQVSDRPSLSVSGQAVGQPPSSRCVLSRPSAPFWNQLVSPICSSFPDIHAT